jgi:hypothetical protein
VPDWLSHRNARLVHAIVAKGGDPRCPTCATELEVKAGGGDAGVLMVTEWYVACPSCQLEASLPASGRSWLRRL